MKINKITFLLLLNIICFTSWSQIIITEVHFDTPYEENNDLRDVFHHHLGEYIELYNYSDKDISLKEWSITDYIGKFKFPDDAVINSGDFLIIAFRDEGAINLGVNIPNFPNNNYFPIMFPNTQGQESKIIYQDKIILRNAFETIRTHVGFINTTNCNNFKIQEITVGYGYPDGTENNSSDAVTLPLGYDFYSSTSVHLASNGLYEIGSPTPLQSDYLPAIQNFETIPTVLDALFTNYNFITWEEYSNEILLNTCSLVISEIDQSPSGFYEVEGLCFNYDVSGNTTSIVNCDPDDEVPVTTTEYTESEIEEIDSKIYLFPNPTYSILNVTWDASINGKLTEMQVTNSNGVNINITTISPTQSGTTVDLSFYPTGLYIIKFELDTGQFISRNVIKI
ncbi:MULTISPECIES: lamin tail domain-containing protein [unclassified Flavobacterium]|uniref:lamin tail domain-containing protein n=1 Tax=unclassified Flavobacterium TaxID=196869 RepID=UPI0012914D25|nr:MULTISPECIES: lamin tail domain-containing protein [unclassified Flavobacterium]MQP53281.1 T9SS type A sorting domain-containing protein [Flavobacterium sp. LMO9]MQP63292.1 T9SS type A sorting domain-containing protein [Flavobacterium sp. LMO6]